MALLHAPVIKGAMTLMNRRRSTFLSAAAPIACAGLLMAMPAGAQTAASPVTETSHSFSIPAGRLAQSVLALSEQAGVQVVFDSETTGSVEGNAVSGSLPVSQALDQLLGGTNLSWRWLRSGVVTIEAKVAADGERVTGAVRVEGAQGSPYFGGAGVAAGVNGINGSRDITATEGTGSFTSGALTVGSKAPQSMEDVPLSVSVLTSEQMQQQNVTDFTSAMRQLPGISLVQGASSIESSFFSRGFEITSIQVDGGPPLSTQFGFNPQIDMAIYDHVELLRGAAGQFNGYGDPGGTVNLVRKKPLDRAQYTLEAQVASWNNYRLVADATSPIGLDGALRGRLVMTYQDRQYFYDTAKDNKTLIYGIAELDASPTTLLTAGISYVRQNSVPWFQGLPRYLDGGDLKLPRSTCLCFDWNRWNFDTTELFGGIEQKLADEWTAKANVTWSRQNSMRKLGYSFGAVNPTNLKGTMLNGSYGGFASNQLAAEATISGAFTLFGQRQELTAGVSRSRNDGSGRRSFAPLVIGTSAAPYQPYPGGPSFYPGSANGSQPPINVFDFDPSNPLFSEPRSSLQLNYSPVLLGKQTVAYLNLRLTAFDRLHLMTGVRWSRYDSQSTTQTLCRTTTGACLGKQIGDVYITQVANYSSSEFSWPPTVTLSYDITKDVTAYVGYTDIYKSQGNFQAADGSTLDPVTGSNWEGGVKWAARGGRLNLAASLYRIRQKGFPIPDGPTEQVSPGVSCCYLKDANQTLISQGFDLEATGEIMPGWQIAGSYTYNDNKREGSTFGEEEGTTFISISPRHLYKLWTTYDFAAAGHKGFLGDVSVSGGLNGQSSGYVEGEVCSIFEGTPNPITGAQLCADDGYTLFAFTVPAYVVVSARIDYRISDNWSLALNLENLLDKTYYQTVDDTVIGGNWYGTPRSFALTLRAKW